MNSCRTSTLATTVVLGTALISGCSFSTSSESSSDSVGSLSDSSGGIFKSASSPFTSSSDSSRNKRDKYETDVADYTATFVVSSSGTLDSFRGHLSELAESHEITNWETDRNTYVGIGRGLAKAKLGKPQISAFTESLSDNEPWKKQAIEEGLKK